MLGSVMPFHRSFFFFKYSDRSCSKTFSWYCIGYLIYCIKIDTLYGIVSIHYMVLYCLGRSSLCSCRSRGHGLSHNICPIKEAFHGMPIAVGTSQELPHSWGDKQKGAWDQPKKKKKKGRKRATVKVSRRNKYICKRKRKQKEEETSQELCCQWEEGHSYREQCQNRSLKNCPLSWQIQA